MTQQSKDNGMPIGRCLREAHANGCAHPGIAPALAEAEHRRRPGRPPQFARRRRGFSSVMATFYVVLFASLAIAYTAMSGSSAEIAGNTRAVQSAYNAAESGMSVIRYHIGGLEFNGEMSSEEIFASVGAQLSSALNGTLNFDQGSYVSYNADEIVIPSIPVDSELAGSSFSARITRDDTTYVLTVTGTSGNISRTLQVSFVEDSGDGSGGFPTHGIISRGSVSINGSAILRSNIPGGSSVMSLDPNAWQPIRINGSGQYDGDFYTVKEGVEAGDIFNGAHQFLNAQTGTYETNAEDHVHAGIDEPAWPQVDTQTFANLINSLPHTVISGNYNGNQALGNVLVPANSDPRFNGTTTINGLVYVEWPNDLRFNGSLNITGMIVFEKPPYEPDVDDSPTNELTFNGSIQAQGPDQLPQTSEYTGLHEQLHTFLLAPDVEVRFNGAFGNVVGSIYTSSLRMNGATSGTIRGSIIIDRRTEFDKNGSMNVFFEVDEDADSMAGLVFEGNKYLRLVPDSYQEV